MKYSPRTQVHEEEKEIKKKDKDGKDITEKKKWKYFELSDYHYISYVGLKEAVEEVARGLVDIGVGKDDVFNIYAATRCVLFRGRHAFSPPVDEFSSWIVVWSCCQSAPGPCARLLYAKCDALWMRDVCSLAAAESSKVGSRAMRAPMIRCARRTLPL
jgi:hypothetical protein